MEEWFGISRQTVSRNMDKLAEKGFIIKETLKDLINPMIKHNNYKVDVEKITELCEAADYDSYANFLDSYRSILKQKFPDDGTTIDEYLDALATWHENKNIEICITLNELAQLITFGDTSSRPSISDMLTNLRSVSKKVKKSNISSYVEKPSLKKEAAESANKLFKTPKRKTKKQLQAEWEDEKRAAVNSFVLLKVGGNEELLELLNKFLDTENGKSYSPQQWLQQLDNLYENGRTVDRMIKGVKNSYMNNYKTLYIVDKSEVDMELKLSEIDNYVNEFADGNEELKDLLIAYVTEVPKGKSYTIRQFRLALKNLSSICITTDEKIQSVEKSYANSYSALAYANSVKTNQSNQADKEIDSEEKENIVNKFIDDGCYYLCDGLKDALIAYIKTTKAGKSMSAAMFKTVLDNLRLFCLDDNDKIMKINAAIQNNYSKLATEDFEESRKIKSRNETRETVANRLDRSRKQRVYMEQQKHPKNQMLKDIIIKF
jgi:predicted RNA-binding protein with PIN domain